MNKFPQTLLVCVFVGALVSLSLHAQKAPQAPALPKFLIVGSDSVEREVAEVAQRLQGKANVVHAQPSVNTGGEVLGNLERWLAQEKPQVIMLVPGSTEKPTDWGEAVDRLQKQPDLAVVIASDTALAGWRSTGVPVLDLSPAKNAPAEALADCLLRQWIVLQYSKPDKPHPGGPEVAAKYRADEAKHDAEVPEIFKHLPIGQFEVPATADAWQQRRGAVSRIVKESLGDLPPRPAPVKARVVSREFRRDYVLERVSIDNGVGNDVSALVLIPEKRTQPAPAILWLHSSTPDKNALITPGADPESLGEAFVRNGYVVVAPDAWYYGDRAENVPSGPMDVYHRGVPPHADLAQNTLIKLNLWLGRTVWGMMVRDDQVALDYLCQRPEVDVKRIGATGMSMGSTRAWWLAAVDERVAATVGVACLTRYENLMRHGNLRAHGLYYFTYGLLKHFDTEGVLALIAPRPFLALTGDIDYGSPVDGVRVLEEKVSGVYRAVGVADNFQSIVYPDTGHVYTPEMRREMLAWFEKWLKQPAAR